jgi:nitroreductase
MTISVFEAMETRRSVRAFLNKPVDQEMVRRILELAARAPSGTNIQPWRVWALSGEPLKALTEELMQAHHHDSQSHTEEYPYYPSEWTEPYLSRRREIGKALYALVGIEKGDKEAMKKQQGRNYVFFDAPVGLFITIEKKMNIGSWFDLGTFLQSILLAARGFGLHTCPQQSFSQYHKIIHQKLSIPDDQTIACGVAIGYEDTNNPVNKLATNREPVESFTQFMF